MAKSLRSKFKRKMRTLKRAQVFGPVEDSRLERLAEKQAELHEVPVEATAVGSSDEAIEERGRSGQNKNQEDVKMDVEGKKLSGMAKAKAFLSRQQYRRKVMQLKQKKHQQNKRK